MRELGCDELQGFLLGRPMAAAGCRPQETTLKIGGGPHGGTFENIADGLAEVLGDILPGVRVSVAASGGSIANLV